MTSQTQHQFRYLAYNVTSVLFSGAATGQCGVSWHPEYGSYPEQTQTATHRNAATSARCYFSWIFTERWSAFSLFSVKIVLFCLRYILDLLPFLTVRPCTFRSHVICPSVFGDVGGSWPHRLEVLETNCMDN